MEQTVGASLGDLSLSLLSSLFFRIGMLCCWLEPALSPCSSSTMRVRIAFNSISGRWNRKKQLSSCKWFHLPPLLPSVKRPTWMPSDSIFGTARSRCWCSRIWLPNPSEVTCEEAIKVSSLDNLFKIRDHNPFVLSEGRSYYYVFYRTYLHPNTAKMSLSETRTSVSGSATGQGPHRPQPHLYAPRRRLCTWPVRAATRYLALPHTVLARVV